MTNHSNKKSKSKSKSKSKKQKMHYMVGCSTKTRKRNKHNKNKRNNKYLGGSPFFAYPDNNIERVPNPHLAYTGGSTIPDNIPVNPNGENPYLPNTGPEYEAGKNTIRLRAGEKYHTCCKCCKCKNCQHKKTKGVKNRKSRTCCSCCTCKNCQHKKMKQKGGKYPDGLVGTPWTPNPSSNELIPGNGNHYALNTYDNDVSRQMVDVGANPPYLYLNGGKKHIKTKMKKMKKMTKKNQKGGNLSNFLAQDLINLGRQAQFGLGSAYNALAGYQQPVNPLPWKDQMTHNSNSNMNMNARQI